jgi:hypothetical protein
VVPFYGFLKLISRIKFEQLREYGIYLVHGLSLLVGVGFGDFYYPTRQGKQAMHF